MEHPYVGSLTSKQLWWCSHGHPKSSQHLLAIAGRLRSLRFLDMMGLTWFYLSNISQIEINRMAFPSGFLQTFMVFLYIYFNVTWTSLIQFTDGHFPYMTFSAPWEQLRPSGISPCLSSEGRAHVAPWRSCPTNGLILSLLGLAFHENHDLESLPQDRVGCNVYIHLFCTMVGWENSLLQRRAAFLNSTWWSFPLLLRFTSPWASIANRSCCSCKIATSRFWCDDNIPTTTRSKIS